MNCDLCGAASVPWKACRRCGLEPKRQDTRKRPEHASEGDPCGKCGLPGDEHRIRAKHPGKYYRRDPRYYGIDGEGQGRADHKYIFLAVSNGDMSDKRSVENLDGLGTVQAFDFLLSLPSPNDRTRIFSFSFNYDLTKIVKDLPDDVVYRLFRPDLRQRLGKEAMKGPKPVHWNSYWLNLQGTKFTIKRGKKRVVVWDLFKFYQSKFVAACRDWGVGTKEELDLMQLMKDKRHEFDKMPFSEVKEYCFKECSFMAQLGRKLVDAHEAAGLTLKSFYGAGSSGGAMLKVMGIEEKIRPAPDAMKEAVACAFVGGRFENSVIGKIEGKVYNKDISSAYPYHLTFLPCLVHGRWEFTKRRRDLDNCQHALVQYSLRSNRKSYSWAPFPFRESNGSISFPIESGGGWVYRDEYLAGERLFAHVQFLGAFTYKSDCACRPFARMPEYYRERLRLKKEGSGIVIKLGMNSCYGKLAQSVGNAPFNSWLWAGMITSGCRAQVLEVLGLHKDPANLLMVATDGIYSRENVECPDPHDTGTHSTGKPLGGWETTPVERGVFIARPGIYFPLSPTEKDLKAVRGRGVGKGVILENWQSIIDSWETHGLTQTAHVANVSRFCGAKTSISKSKAGYRRADGTKSTISYGQWIQRTVEMSFHPMPKREGINKDGVTLALRKFPKDMTSAPYRKAMVSKETLEMRAAVQEAIEQPDSDFADYEIAGSAES